MRIGIEGYWSVGKSTTGQHLAQQMEGLYVPEPDHLVESGTIDDLDMWYRAAFVALHNRNYSHDFVVTDRTPLSVVAFMRAMGKPATEAFVEPLRTVQGNYDAVFVLPPREGDLGAKYDPTPFVRDPDFSRSYQHSLHEILEEAETPPIFIEPTESAEASAAAIQRYLA